MIGMLKEGRKNAKLMKKNKKRKSHV